MTDDIQPTPAAEPASAAERPQISILSQYVKDFSFENPNAPRTMAPTGQPPQVKVNVDVRTSPLDDGSFEVVLHIKGDAMAGDQKAFIVELAYAGVVTLQNVAREQSAAFLLIEAPRQLFPFARAIVADAVRNGGYPPLLVQPIDFVDLFRRQLDANRARQQQQQQQAGESPPPVN